MFIKKFQLAITSAALSATASATSEVEDKFNSITLEIVRDGVKSESITAALDEDREITTKMLDHVDYISSVSNIYMDTETCEEDSNGIEQCTVEEILVKQDFDTNTVTEGFEAIISPLDNSTAVLELNITNLKEMRRFENDIGDVVELPMIDRTKFVSTINLVKSESPIVIFSTSTPTGNAFTSSHNERTIKVQYKLN
ncbi:exported hypothetical protein [Vibrio chagasii]|nr:exported hypothetical protein [Vibrio chagasii]